MIPANDLNSRADGPILRDMRRTELRTLPREAILRLRRGGRRALLLVCVFLLPGLVPGWAAIDEPSLWTKTFRAELVVRVRVLDGDNRLATMKVEEIIKGDYDRETLRVVFRAMNLSRNYWEEKVVFPLGAHEILFLRPFVKKGKVNAPDQFELVGGHHGTEEVPPEGNDAYLQAIRQFVIIQGMGSQLAIWNQSRQLLESENPYLVQAGFEQVLRFRLADEEMVPVLLLRLEDETVAFRSQAARCLRDVFEDFRREKKTLTAEDHLRDMLLFKAMNDQSVDVRVEAIRTLQAGRDADLVPSFRQIAREDPSQAVRYQAERTIHEIQGTSSVGKE